jgi:hypothetical protein
LLFILNRRRVIAETVPPLRIVEHFAIVEDILPYLIAGAVSLPPNSFPFEQLEEALGNGAANAVQMHFCDPRSPWQRGTNENTNRLLRQYFPAGANLAEYSQSELNVTAHKLNTRPRKILAYMAPIDKIAEALR